MLGLFMLVPQVIDRYATGQAADPTLAGVGMAMLLAASGGTRAIDALAQKWDKSK